MPKILNIAKWVSTLGSSTQTFLGAKWVTGLLKLSPKSSKRIWALRLLSLSPHYFINPENPEYDGLSNREYLEAAFQGGGRSRQLIYDHILKDYLHTDYSVLDYGCGPGFLAKILAGRVTQVYACDISAGALACAEVLNSAPNLKYVLADASGMESIPDESLNAIVSFAMAQHLSNEVLDLVLANCLRKLKAGGRLLLHIQLLHDGWKSEEEWKSDTSVRGKLKLRYGLHCFGRTEAAYRDKIANHGFKEIEIVKIADLVPDNFDDIWSQHLLKALK